MLTLLALKRFLPLLSRKHSWKALGQSCRPWTATAPRAKDPIAIFITVHSIMNQVNVLHVFYLCQGHLLRPFSVAYTKGYKRCLILLLTIQGIRELNLADSVPSFVRVAWLNHWFLGFL